MEDNEANSFQNILLDNIDIPINISLLSTTKPLNSNFGLIVDKRKHSRKGLSCNKNRRILKSAVRPSSIRALEESNYERGFKRT